MSSLLSMTFNFPNNTRLNTKQKQNFTVVFLTAVIFFFFFYNILQYLKIIATGLVIMMNQHIGAHKKSVFLRFLLDHIFTARLAY